VPALGPAWWAVHVAVVLAVLVGAWAIAGGMARVDRAVDRMPAAVGMPGPSAAIVGGLAVLVTSATGFATWWGRGPLGSPAASWIDLLVIVAAWQGAGRRRTGRTS
jgi:uncharacterized iron-regulated membrane protein